MTIKRKIVTLLLGMSLYPLSALAVQADGANFCSDKDFANPVNYVALRDAKTYTDALAEGYIEQAVWKGNKIKKGTVVKVYAIGKNCNTPKTVFMNTDDIGFTGVKMSDFKQVK